MGFHADKTPATRRAQQLFALCGGMDGEKSRGWIYETGDQTELRLFQTITGASIHVDKPNEQIW